MARGFTQHAEIVRGRHESLGEVTLPDAVHHDAGGEGIFLTRDPVGEGGAASCRFLRRGDLRRGLTEQGQKGGLDDFVFAAKFQQGVGGFRTDVGGDEGSRERGRLEWVEGLELFSQLGVESEFLFIFGKGLFVIKTAVFEVDLALHELGDLLFVGVALFGLFPINRLNIFGELNHCALASPFAHARGDAVELIAQVFGGGFPRGHLRVEGGALFGSGEELVFGPPGRVEEGLHREVVLLQNGIELVIVALRAAHSETEKGLACDVGHLGENEVPLHLRVALVPFVDPETQERGRDEGFWIISRDLVGGELLADELVVGLVLVEGAHHVVAIHPRLGAVVIGTVAVALGVAHHVEPVLTPAFAIAGTLEETVDEVAGGFVRILREGLAEGDNIFGSRGQAVEVKKEAAHELAGIGGGGGFEVIFLQLLRDEMIDRTFRPAFAAGGQDGFGHGLDRPPVFVFFGEAVPVGLALCGHFGGPGRTEGDPFFEGGDLGGLKLFLRRHGKVGIGATDRFDHDGLGRLPRDESRTGVAAGDHERTMIESKPGLGLFGSVAVVALGREKRTNLVLEKLERLTVISREGGQNQ